MRGLYAVIAMLTAAIISSTVAVAPCDTKIVEQLSKCYKDGKTPSWPISAARNVGTLVAISEGELPDNTKCVRAKAEGTKVAVTLFGDNGRDDIPYEMKLEPKTDHVLETGPKASFKLYVTHYEANVISYYKCIDAPEAEGHEGTPMGQIGIDCKNRIAGSDAVIQQAMRCFDEIGIKNVKAIAPCDATLCD